MSKLVTKSHVRDAVHMYLVKWGAMLTRSLLHSASHCPENRHISRQKQHCVDWRKFFFSPLSLLYHSKKKHLTYYRIEPTSAAKKVFAVPIIYLYPKLVPFVATYHDRNVFGPSC
jgi:hypothetical protein